MEFEYKQYKKKDSLTPPPPKKKKEKALNTEWRGGEGEGVTHTYRALASFSLSNILAM